MYVYVNTEVITICILIAQKVWDDIPLYNADFQFLYPVLKPKDINKLEALILGLLDYDVSKGVWVSVSEWE